MITSNINQKIFMLFTDGVNHWYGFGTELEQAKRLERIKKLNPEREILNFEIQEYSDKFISQVFNENLREQLRLLNQEREGGHQDA